MGYAVVPDDWRVADSGWGDDVGLTKAKPAADRPGAKKHVRLYAVDIYVYHLPYARRVGRLLGV